MTPEQHYDAAVKLISELHGITGSKVVQLHLRAAEVGNQLRSFHAAATSGRPDIARAAQALLGPKPPKVRERISSALRHRSLSITADRLQRFTAVCACGWSTGPSDTTREVVDAWDNHATENN